MFQKVFFGKLDKARNGHLPDLKGHELATFIPLVIAIVLGGLFQKPLLAVMEPSVQKFVQDFNRRVDDCVPPSQLKKLEPGEKLPSPTNDELKAADACRTQTHRYGEPPPPTTPPTMPGGQR